ncbi:MAG: Rieske 2Fe-2S domain-containing protein [Myxococcota bacterium]
MPQFPKGNSQEPDSAPSRFPFPIPRGWFQVAYSDEIPPGSVQPSRYFGQDLVIGRTEAGAAFVFDAHCPHLGAHLGKGGRVESEYLHCPFHGWRFDQDGACANVPYAKSNRVPRGSQLKRWPSVERNGMLMVWHDPLGNPPSWDVRSFEEFEAPGWSTYWRHRLEVRTCTQEILENVADRAHFHFVHGTVDVPETLLSMEGPKLRAEQITQFKTPHGVVDGGIISNYDGLGFGTARFTGICEALLILATTPITADLIDVRFSLTIDQSSGASTERGVGKAIITDIIQQFLEDIPIWENKRFNPKPLLCDGDGEITRYRSWASQFY